MQARRPDDPSGDLAAVLDWWREAGVDYGFADAPRQWIVAADKQGEAPVEVDPNSFPAVRTIAVAAPTPVGEPFGGDRARWPATLPAFAEWWLTEPALDAGQARARVPPRGAVAAPLMILVPEPEAQDGDTLLSGARGRLLAAMLAAMGLNEDQVYFASALPRHTPMADWRDLAARGLGDVLHMHVALARPERIIGFGRQFLTLGQPAVFASPLQDHVLPQSGPNCRHFRHQGESVPLLVASDLGSLLERPIAKRNFWLQWLTWSAG